MAKAVATLVLQDMIAYQGLVIHQILHGLLTVCLSELPLPNQM